MKTLFEITPPLWFCQVGIFLSRQCEVWKMEFIFTIPMISICWFTYSFYIFQVSPCALWGRTLRILVFNIDVNRKHRIVGQTLLDLADVDLSQGKLVSRQIGKPKVFILFSLLRQRFKPKLFECCLRQKLQKKTM